MAKIEPKKDTVEEIIKVSKISNQNIKNEELSSFLTTMTDLLAQKNPLNNTDCMGAILRYIFLKIYYCIVQLDFAVSMFREINECVVSFNFNQNIPSEPGKVSTFEDK